MLLTFPYTILFTFTPKSFNQNSFTMRKIYQILMLAVFMLLSGATYAQGTVKGKVLDAEINDGLIGATIIVVYQIALLPL